MSFIITPMAHATKRYTTTSTDIASSHKEVLRHVIASYGIHCLSPCDFPVIAHVCKEWRDCALSSPVLWTTLCICKFRFPAQIDFYVRCLGEERMTIKVDTHEADLYELVPDVAAYARKIYAIHACVSYDDLLDVETDPTDAAEEYASSLSNAIRSCSFYTEELRIIWAFPDRRGSQYPVIRPSSISATRITALQLSGVQWNIEHNPRTNHKLTYLSLTSLPEVGDADLLDLLSFIGASPRLQTLILDNALDWPCGRVKDVAELLSLRTLLIRQNTKDIIPFLSAIRTPILKSFGIWLIADVDDRNGDVAKLAYSIVSSQFARQPFLNGSMQSVYVSHDQSSYYHLTCTTTDNHKERSFWSRSENISRPNSVDNLLVQYLSMQGSLGSETKFFHLAIVSSIYSRSLYNPNIFSSEIATRASIPSLPTISETSYLHVRGMGHAIGSYICAFRPESLDIAGKDDFMTDWVTMLPNAVRRRIRRVTYEECPMTVSTKAILDDFIEYKLSTE